MTEQPANLARAVQTELGRPDQDGRDLGSGREGLGPDEPSPPSPAANEPNDHGWTQVGRTTDGGVVSIGRATDRLTCGCTFGFCPCTRVATQEDLLCDTCRARCAHLRTRRISEGTE